MMRKTIKDIISLKAKKQKIAVLTCYTSNYSKILDEYCDILLVGDSLGMVLYGFESTLPVTLDLMINHGKAVVNSSKNALVIVDMPFGTYQESKEVAFRNCARVMKETGCSAVKIEGGAEMSDTIKYLTERAIPVMAHIGLQPQYFNVLGGYSVQGKTSDSKKQLIDDLKAVEKAGAFAVVLEGTVKSVADEICKIAKIPVIGIGATDKCDGQVLVTEDMLGFFDKTPKFVKKYADLKKIISKAISDYTKEVRSNQFPEKENLY